MFVSKISKTFVFLLKNVWRIFNKIWTGIRFPTYPWKHILKTDPYVNIVTFAPDVLKNKTKDLNIPNTDKMCFLKNNVESSPQDIWIRFRFLEKKRIHITAFKPCNLVEVRSYGQLL